MSRQYTPIGSQNTVSTGAASTDTCPMLCRENPVSTASSCPLTAIICPNDTVSSTLHDKPPASPLRTPLSLAPYDPVSSKFPKNTAILTLFRPYMCSSPPIISSHAPSPSPKPPPKSSQSKQISLAFSLGLFPQIFHLSCKMKP